MHALFGNIFTAWETEERTIHTRVAKVMFFMSNWASIQIFKFLYLEQGIRI